MKYIVGLGNPGKEYEGTRHNIGFAVVETFALAHHFSSWHNSSANSGEMAKGTVAEEEVSLLKPSTFMNDSGVAVRKLVPKGEEEKLIVVHDDIDVPLGEVKISFDRGTGGHNGLKSIVEKLGTEGFLRVRVGVAQKSIWTGKPKRPKGGALPKFVLTPFSRRDEKKVQETLALVVDALLCIVKEGKEKAMNKFN